MADKTQFTIGTEASCSDGAVGTLSRVIVDPVAEAVTHCGRSGARASDGRLVPLDLIDVAAGGKRILRPKIIAWRPAWRTWQA